MLHYFQISSTNTWLYLIAFLFSFQPDVDPLVLSFRVKFYPADPLRLTSNGKLMLYQQLKRDLRHGRLYCSAGEAAALGALIVQGKWSWPPHPGDHSLSVTAISTKSHCIVWLCLFMKRNSICQNAFSIGNISSMCSFSSDFSAT